MLATPKTLQLVETTCAAPATVRGQASLISADKSTRLIAYGSGTEVFVRDVEDASSVKICTSHTTAVTAARLAPSGRLCASGDKEGNVLVWTVKDAPVVQQQSKPIAGAIRDIAWSDDEERMIVVGEGKAGACAHVFAVDGGNTIGNVAGHAKAIITCDFKKTRPFRIATGAMDTQTNFYEGPPFKFVRSHTEGNTGNVNCVRFSPCGNHIAAVSGSKNIGIYDAKTGDQQQILATAHTGSIYAIAWSLDSTKIATASADKSVKVYTLAGELVLSHGFGKDLQDMQLGVCFGAQGLLTFDLAGNINVLELGASDAKVKRVLRGHQRPLAFLHYVAGAGALFSASGDAHVLAWKSADEAETVAADVFKKDGIITSAATSAKGTELLVSGSENIYVVDPVEKSAQVAVSGSGNFVRIAPLGDASGTIAAITKRKLEVFSGGKKVHEEKYTGDEASSLATFGDRIAVGTDKGVHMYVFEGGKVTAIPVTFEAAHRAAVTALAFSADGKQLASGDSMRHIFVSDPSSGKLIHDDLLSHTSRIMCLTFADENTLVSGSVDASIIVWDLPAKKRIVQDNAHRSGVNCIEYLPHEKKIVSGGADNCIRYWTIPK